MREGNKNAVKHGCRNTATYQAWIDMRRRCHNEDHPAFKWYGARGIAVCVSWRDSFAAFLRDMGERPAGTSLDRIDNSQGYAPNNCRWALPQEQQGNRRSCRLLEFGGESLTIAAWARRLGVGKSTIAERLARGWSIERALGERIRSEHGPRI